ncbi:creatininase family protein, partial [Halorubrum sp. AJ67]|uniref:creatininase family protein n=1 Tax=Halorubrum sp. AJ67 TaxID=1173487 RepID=UPI001896420B
MRLSEVTWTDARDADVDVAFLPVGSTEQHGPHAPLGTDTLNAVAVADAGADAY